MSPDAKFYISLVACILLFAMIVASYTANLQPKSSQNKALVVMIVVTSFLASITGWVMANFFIKGDVTTQIHFLIFTVMILFAMNIVSGSVAAMQLYGLRDSIAANTQGSA